MDVETQITAIAMDSEKAFNKIPYAFMTKSPRGSKQD